MLGVTLGHAIERAFGVEALQVSPTLNLGMSVLYETPRELGVDRLLNAIAAFERVNGPAIVVDFGTATKLDCVSPKGEYMGGAIAPGLRTSLDGLIERAAKLSQVELSAPTRTLGRNTTHALQSGVIFGHAAMVDGMVERLQIDLGYKCHVIATGGLAGLIAEHAKRVNELEPNLTLEGLRILHARNAAHARGTVAP
jgi:type III pantothenate kinase